MSSSSSSDHLPSNYVCDTLPKATRLVSTPPRTPSPNYISSSQEHHRITRPVNTSTSLSVQSPALRRPFPTMENEVRASTPPSLIQPPARKLCVRHQRMADEGTNLKLQQALDALPVHEREAVNAVWSNFSSSTHQRRALILHGLLTMCCFSQLSLLTEQLSHLIRIDPFSVLPREVSLKILGYLDATSLCRAAQVSRQWRCLADDDILWRGICEQHIGQKCLKCGWGLPILGRRRATRPPSSPPSIPASIPASTPSPSPPNKRELEPDPQSSFPPFKRQRSEPEPPQAGPSSMQTVSSYFPSSPSPYPPSDGASTPNPLVAPRNPQPMEMFTRPWKDVYCERLTIERNWRRGRCTVRTLKGHTDGVMCLQFSETLSHPAFPILITGSYDRTARVWNLETGREVLCMTGHTRAVRALQFDEAKLVTGSMDHTMRVWDWRTGKCLKVLEGHTEGVVCLNFDSSILVSGSVDTTVKVWNFRSGECFTLRGHRDWVNAVQLWESSDPTLSLAGVASASSSMYNEYGRPSTPPGCCSAPAIDAGKMLFSASDDGTIRLWDLAQRTCVRQFAGHVGQVQSLKLLIVDQASVDAGTQPGASDTPSPASGAEAGPDGNGNGDREEDADMDMDADASTAHPRPHPEAFTPPLGFDPHAYRFAPNDVPHPRAFVHPTDESAEPSTSKGKDRDRDRDHDKDKDGEHGSPVTKPVLISGSLDNTIKVWDIGTGKAVKTLFGHIEGVWAVASDKLRLVSGSHDRTIKVWNREEGRCVSTLVGHRGAVTCLALGEDKIVSGSDDGDVRIWSFGG